MKLFSLLLPLAFLAAAASVSAEIEGEVHVGYSSVFPSKVLKAETKSFRKADKNDDDAVSYDEFKALLKPLAIALKKFPATGRGDHPEELLDLCEEFFDLFDANLDDSLDFDEWLLSRQRIDPQVMAELLVGLPGLDRNGNGRVRAMEFLPLVKCFVPLSKAKAVFREIVHPYTYNGGGTLSLGGSNGSFAGSGFIASTWTVELASGNTVNGSLLSPGNSSGTLTPTPGLGLSESWITWDLGNATPWLIFSLAGSLPEGTLLLSIDSSATGAP